MGVSRRLLRQLFARLLAHHVLGVPIWPVRVGLPDALLVLDVRGRGASKCARQVVRRRKGRRRGVDATGQPLRDFLQQPAVAVWIYEGNEGAVAEMVGLWAADAVADALKPAGGSFSTVKGLACVNAGFPAASLLRISFVLIADSCVVGDRGRIHTRGRNDADDPVGS
ncbi:MAG: hypothetical protein WA869_22770 [Alloacidobacterium sp.]